MTGGDECPNCGLGQYADHPHYPFCDQRCEDNLAAEHARNKAERERLAMRLQLLRWQIDVAVTTARAWLRQKIRV